MSATIDAEKRVGRITAEKGVTIATLQPLRERLLIEFRGVDTVELDFGTCDEIDVAGLQMLCATHRFALEHGKELVLTGRGERFYRMVNTTGFARGSSCRIGRDAPCIWMKVA